MAKWRLKLPLIDAVKWDPKTPHSEWPLWLLTGTSGRQLSSDGAFCFKTVDGQQIAHPGDYLVRGACGEVFPCRPETFLGAYEPAE